MLFTNLLGLFFTVTAIPSRGQYEGQKVVRFEIKNQAQLQLFQALQARFDLDTWSHLGVGPVDIRVNHSQLQAIQSVLPDVKAEVVINDVQALVDAEKEYSLSVQSFGQADLTDPAVIFKDYQSTENYLAFLQSLPGASLITLGKTYENRTINGIKFGSGAKQIVFNGGIHAREWISPATVTYIASFLTGNSTRAASLRGNFTFHLIPVLNPDGYAYTRASDRMWRKNREPNTGSSCVGTDPNRNFDLAWSKPGASSSKCAADYYGPSPMSSHEASSLAAYIATLSNVISYIDFHSYSNLWMYPFGYSCSASTGADAKDLDAASALAVKALAAVNGQQFKYGPICSTIYQASGTTADYFYTKAGVKYSMAVELRGTSFTLPASQIVPAGEETLQGALAFWEYVATH